MRIDNIFERQGKWLFRWRSYLPLLMIGIIILALAYVEPPGHDDTGVDFEDVWAVICLAVSFFGFFIRIYTIGYVPEGTSGRNTKEQRADALNTTAAYSLVRHPLYLGNFFLWLGISMFLGLWWLSVIFVLVFWLFYERIIYLEEKYLQSKFGKTWEDWAARTPIILPKFKGFKRPALPFSIRNVLSKENHIFLNVILAFTFLELIGGLFAEREFELDLPWCIFLGFGLVVWIVLRILKKKTSILKVEGR